MKGMISDAGTGKVSHTKVWANIAYAVATWVVIRLTIMGKLDFEIFGLYLAVVAASASASKFFALKYGKDHD